MSRPVRKLFWVEAGGASMTAVLTAVTLVTREWIEVLFHVDPDGGSGVVEWGVVLVTLSMTVVLTAMASYEWRRIAPPAMA